MLPGIVFQNTEEFFNKKILLIAAAFSVYTTYLLYQFPVVEVSFWEFLILVLSDQHYILYFMVVTYCFFVFRFIRHEDTLIWIRSGSYLRLFISTSLSLLVISTLFVLLHIFIAVIVGFGLRMNHVYSTIHSDVLLTYREYYETPILTLLFETTYLIFGFTLLGSTLIFLMKVLDSKWFLITVMLGYFSMLLSIRSPLDDHFPFLFFNNYIILHHALSALKSKVYFLALAGLAWYGLMLFIIKRYWDQKLTTSRLLRLVTQDSNKLLFLFSFKNFVGIMGLLILGTLSVVVANRGLTSWDLFVFQFFGHGQGYFHMVDFLHMIIYNGVPLYILIVFLEKESISRDSIVLIRLKEKKAWLYSILRSVMLFIVGYVLLSLTVGIGISALLGLSFDHFEIATRLFEVGDLEPPKISNLIIIIIGMKVLEVFFSFLVILLFFCLGLGTLWGFIALQASYFVSIGMVTGSVVKFFPVGISSLARLSEFVGNQGVPSSVALRVLLLAIFTLLIILRLCVYQRAFDSR